MRTPRNTATVALAACLFLLSSLTTHAQDPVSRIIDRAAQRGNELIAQAENSGNALLAQFGNQLRVASQNALNGLGDLTQKSLADLGQKERVLVLEVERLLGESAKLSDAAFKLKDSTVLDLYTLSGSSVFAQKYAFLVQRIDGLTQIASNGDYKVWITGLGFGPDTSRSRSRTVAFTINGQAVSTAESTPQAFVSEFVLPGGVLKPLFADDVLRTVSVRVEREVTTSGYFFWNSPTKHSIAFNLALMPRRAGQADVVYRRPRFAWTTATTQHVTSWTNPDHHQSGRDPRFFAYDRAFLVDDKKRFVPPIFYTHSGEGCGHTRNQRVEIINNEKDAHLYLEVQGSPCTHTWGAKLEEFRPAGEEEQRTQVVLEYGTNLVLELPSDVSYWRLIGTSATRERFDVVGQQDGGPLKYANEYKSGEKLYVVYKVSNPAW